MFQIFKQHATTFTLLTNVVAVAVTFILSEVAEIPTLTLQRDISRFCSAS